ncbi:MAG TPA: hypothetical protein VFI97_05555 [Arthrobacter sp.]|nr:hypothetical protein [Arthrobacter sp.]
MSRVLDQVDVAIARMPWDDGEKSRVRGRARRYDHACGCALGGAFSILALLACLASLVLADRFSWGLIPLGVAGVFCAGMLGKAIGIGWAKARLRLLHRSLVHRIPT